jgi:hypothetical protein
MLDILSWTVGWYEVAGCCRVGVGGVVSGGCLESECVGRPFGWFGVIVCSRGKMTKHVI